ncbi:hypothetical protein EU523_01020, partial [Candidatus Heimdallarchaeota archaeon]
MRNLGILLWDEFRGFIKSKVMIALFVGMPVFAIVMHFIQPDTEGIPITMITSLFVSSIGGLLAAVMLSTTMVNELNNNVYDLFLIRPVKRWHIIIVKYISFFSCLIIASLLSFLVGLAIDAFS